MNKSRLCMFRFVKLFISMIKKSIGCILIFWVSILLIFCGCNKPHHSDGNLIQIDRIALKAHLDESFIFNDCGQISHQIYLVPTRKWIEKVFVPYWFEYRKRNNLMYDVDSTNCESFAFQSHFASQSIEGTNVSFGVIFYKPDITDPLKGHAVNIILVNEGDFLTIVFWDPQTSQFVTLSNNEVASCSFFYF